LYVVNLLNDLTASKICKLSISSLITRSSCHLICVLHITHMDWARTTGYIYIFKIANYKIPKFSPMSNIKCGAMLKLLRKPLRLLKPHQYCASLFLFERKSYSLLLYNPRELHSNTHKIKQFFMMSYRAANGNCLCRYHRYCNFFLFLLMSL